MMDRPLLISDLFEHGRRFYGDSRVITAGEGGDRIARAVGRGLRFLWKRRRADGTWCGRWVTNYVYGTSQVLEALACCGEFEGDARAEASLRWLLSVQNADGGWGESRQRV